MGGYIFGCVCVCVWGGGGGGNNVKDPPSRFRDSIVLQPLIFFCNLVGVPSGTLWRNRDGRPPLDGKVHPATGVGGPGGGGVSGPQTHTRGLEWGRLPHQLQHPPHATRGWHQVGVEFFFFGGGGGEGGSVLLNPYPYSLLPVPICDFCSTMFLWVKAECTHGGYKWTNRLKGKRMLRGGGGVWRYFKYKHSIISTV